LFGVGHNPQPLTPVRRAGIIRSDTTPLRIVPQRGQVTEDCSVISTGNKSWHVFQERVPWLDDPQYVTSGGPHIALIVLAPSLAGDGEGLAGKSCGNDINHSRIRSGVNADEFSHIAERWRVVEKPVSDSLSEHPLTVGVPFDVADWPPSEHFGSEQSSARPAE